VFTRLAAAGTASFCSVGFQFIESGGQKNSLFRLMFLLRDFSHRVSMVRVACGSELAGVGRVFN